MQEDMHENNGMTVKQFVDILKKSWVTIVICVLIVAVVFGSFLAIVKVVASDTYYQGTLYFADTSNNESRAADISNLTSADNISKALGDLGYTEEEVASLTGDVRHALSVAPVVPADAHGGETVYVPSTYVLTMQPIGDLGDTENQAILNAVMNRFVSTYSKPGTDVAASIVMTTGNYASYDYLHAIGELIDVTTVNLGSVTNVVNKTASSANQGQHGLFAAVQSRMIGELARLQVLQNTVAVNGIYREGAALSNDDYLKQQIAECEAEVTALDKTVQSYKDLIDSISSQGGQATSNTPTIRTRLRTCRTRTKILRCSRRCRTHTVPQSRRLKRCRQSKKRRCVRTSRAKSNPMPPRSNRCSPRFPNCSTTTTTIPARRQIPSTCSRLRPSCRPARSAIRCCCSRC